MYEQLSAGDEPDVIASAVPPGAAILELGAGVGRVTHPLVERGFAVTAVDESPEMLARIAGARTVCSPIDELDLGERFDAVVLTPDLVHVLPEVRDELLGACRRHVRGDGCVLLRREPAGEGDDLPSERRLPGGGVVRLVSSDLVRPGVWSLELEYVYPSACWIQTSLSCPVSDDELTSCLERARLAVDAYLDEERSWVRALPR